MQDTLIGYVRGQQVSGAFLDSLTGLLGHDGFRTVLGFDAVESGPALAAARNHMAEMFMSVPEAQWLFMVDTDMVFPPDVIDRLKKVASPHIIAGALCFAWFHEARVAKPTMYDENMRTITRWPEGELVPVYATGAACLLIHRRVFEVTPKPWFRQAEDGSYGEDQGFFRNVQAHGVRCVVDTSTQCLHDKGILIGRGDYTPERFEALEAQEAEDRARLSEQSDESGTLDT